MAFDSYTKSLLHFNGANQSQVFTDELGLVWTPYGQAQLDTGQKVFGTAAGRFNRDGSTYISTPQNAVFNIGTANYTIDFRFRIYNSIPSSSILFAMGSLASHPYFINLTTSSITIRSEASNFSFSFTASADTWYHLAIARQASVLRCFIDGVQKGSNTSDGTNITPNLGAYIGRAPDYPGTSYDLNGWIDEFRFSNGRARWTAAFTPPIWEYGGGVFSSTSSIIIPTLSNTMTLTASKFMSVDTITVENLYNERWAGNASAILPALTGAATLNSRSGRVSATLPALTGSAYGLVGDIGGVKAKLPFLVAKATGLTGSIGEAAATLPSLTISASGNQDGHGVCQAKLPALLCTANGQLVPVTLTFKVLAINLKNFAVGEYENFDFNSFGQINGLYVGFKDDGIYPLVGQNDQGVHINAQITTGKAFIEHWRLRDIWSYGLFGGQNRQKLGRGLRSGFVDFTISGENGVPLDLDYFEVMADPIRRKRH